MVPEVTVTSDTVGRLLVSEVSEVTVTSDTKKDRTGTRAPVRQFIEEVSITAGQWAVSSAMTGSALGRSDPNCRS
jgi:hypothetical protein